MGPNPQAQAIGQWITSMSEGFQKWLVGAPDKTVEEERIEEMASIIRTYKGLADVDDNDKENYPLWVDRIGFDLAMSAVVVLNTLTIHLETDYGNPDDRAWHWILFEVLFTFIFVVEILLKCYYHSCKWILLEPSNFLTFCIALMAVIEAAILNPLGHNGTLRVVSLFRIVGLIRLRSAIKQSPLLEELRLVFQGLVDSFKTIVWVVILLFVVVYVSAVFMTREVGHNTEVYGTYLKWSGGWDHQAYFGSVGRSMYTLYQVMTLDSWSSSVARHVINKQMYMAVFFVLFLLVTTYGILNIVVSVIVELMLDASATNEKKMRVQHERARNQEVASMTEIFLISDTDGSGVLDLKEFREAIKNPEVMWRMRQLELPVGDAAKLFGVIDGDGSRSLSIEEFKNGCLKLKGPAQSKDLLAIQAQADTLVRKMDTLAYSVLESERMMGALDEVTMRIAKRFDGAVLGSRRKIAQSVGGSKPMVRPKRESPSDTAAEMNGGNKPVLPKFPNLLK